MILPPCFLTQEEMKDAPSEDLWCEIADAMFCSSPEVDAYVKLLNDELKKKEQNYQ
jgi:hypothetical protein